MNNPITLRGMAIPKIMLKSVVVVVLIGLLVFPPVLFMLEPALHVTHFPFSSFQV